jgi:S1-C subfamily serine protease
MLPHLPRTGRPSINPRQSPDILQIQVTREFLGMRLMHRHIGALLFLVAGVCVVWSAQFVEETAVAMSQAPNATAAAGNASTGTTLTAANGDLTSVSRAVCNVVYPVDETPSTRGYQYIFYGNAFFVGPEGYLITAAHVLHSFSNGGQPHLLVQRKEAPAQMLKVEVVAQDLEHDVAVLRATPNPFQGNYRVAFLALGKGEAIATGQSVVVAALRPSRRRPQTFETELQDRSAAHVVGYESSKLDQGMGETQLLLFNHEVIPGQSGAPVLSSDGREVVGFIEGQWLHPAVSLAATMKPGETSLGAAVPIHYAIALLREKGISWQAHSVQEAGQVGDGRP